MIAAATHSKFKLTWWADKELEAKKVDTGAAPYYASFPTQEREEIELNSEVQDPVDAILNIRWSEARFPVAEKFQRWTQSETADFSAFESSPSIK